jgi:hypothetical protein
MRRTCESRPEIGHGPGRAERAGDQMVGVVPVIQPDPAGTPDDGCQQADGREDLDGVLVPGPLVSAARR